MDVFCKHYAVSFLSFSSVCKGQFLTGINFFKQSYIVLVNLQEVAGGKKFLELLLEANYKFYRLPPDKDNTDHGSLYCCLYAARSSCFPEVVALQLR